MEIHPYVTRSRPELGSESYTFMENDKLISLRKSVLTFTISRYFIWMKNWIYITIFSEKFQNQCNEQTKGKAPSDIFLFLIFNMVVKSL